MLFFCRAARLKDPEAGRGKTVVLGLGGAAIPIQIGDSVSFSIEGMALAAIIGIILNKLLPETTGNQ